MLTTVRPDGSPHAVPITHAVVGSTIVFAVDHKPKSGRALQRLTNIRLDPRVSVLFDHRTDDWDDLWWVRADGIARIREDRPPDADALEAKYPQYRVHVPDGPWVTVTVKSWTGWKATPDEV